MAYQIDYVISYYGQLDYPMTKYYVKFRNALSLLVASEHDVDQLQYLKNQIEIAAPEIELIPTLYILLAQCRKAVNDCQKPEGHMDPQIEKWLKEYLIKVSLYGEAKGAMAACLSLSSRVDLESEESNEITETKKLKVKKIIKPKKEVEK